MKMNYITENALKDAFLDCDVAYFQL